MGGQYYHLRAYTDTVIHTRTTTTTLLVVGNDIALDLSTTISTNTAATATTS